MAVYTIELDRLLQAKDFDIGLDEYPVPSFLTTIEERNSWREALNKKIISHYRFNEICCLPPDRFKVLLNNTMNEQMPYYCKLYEAMNEGWKFYTGSELTEVIKGDATINRTGTDRTDHSGDDKTTSNGATSNLGNTYDLTVASDTPGALLNIESAVQSNTYASAATKNKGNSSSSGTNTNTDKTEYNSADTTTHNTTDKHNDNRNRTVKGLQGKSYAELFKQYAESIRNLDLEVINSVKDCFMSIF